MKNSRTINTILNTGIGFVYLIIHTLYSFVITGIIINYYGSIDNGLVSSIRQLLTYAALVDCGLGAACIMSYYAPIASGNIDKVKQIYEKSKKFFRIVGTFYFLIIVVLGVLYPMIVDTPHSKLYTSCVFIVIGSSQAFSYFAIEKYKCLLTADQNNRFIQIGLLLTDVTATVVVVAVTLAGLVRSILFLQVIISATTLVQYLYLHRIFNKYYGWKDTKDVIVEENENPIKQVKATFVHTIAQTVAYNTDIILLTFFRDLVEVSIYGVYNMVFALANSFFSVFTSGIEGSISNLYNKDKAEFKKLFFQYEYAYLIIDSIIMNAIIIAMKSFITLYTKSEQSVSYWNALVFAMFLIITFFNSLRNPHAMMIRVSENYDATKRIFVIEAVTNLTISLLLVKTFGIVGVLLGTLVSVAIRNVYVIGFIYKNVLKESPVSFVKAICINLLSIGICIAISKISICQSCTTIMGFILVIFIAGGSAIGITFIINYLLNRNRVIDLWFLIKGYCFSFLRNR